MAAASDWQPAALTHRGLGPAERVAQRLNVPCDSYRFGVELKSVKGAATHGIGRDGALLVRPDGFVAWRAQGVNEQYERVLEEVLTNLLARESARQQTTHVPRG